MSSNNNSVHHGDAAATGAHRELPDEKTLAEAGEIMIKDKDGGQLALKSLWSGKAQGEKQLIVFIRHFFCGSCKQYVQALGEGLPEADLAAAGARVAIVGCGGPVCIPLYAEETGCPFPIYADPSLRSHEVLGMASNMRESATRPDYIKTGFLRNVVTSMWGGLASGHALSGGPAGQNGGEWLFEGGGLRWCHRMRNATDHTEVRELKAVLGIGE